MVHVELSDLPLDGTSLWRDLQPRPGKRDKIKGALRFSFVPGAKPAAGATKVESTTEVSNQVTARLKAANEQDATELDLTGCNLSSIPDGVLQVPEWTSLDLGFNVFTAWPDNISTFKYLQDLFLSGNQMVVLPASISALAGSLRSLYLNGNFLASLPPEIGTLTNLEKLDLANNQLKAVPPELGLVSQLEELKLNGNPISTLPAELNQLQYLIQLDLNGCGLRELPEKLFRMPRLLELDLGTNQLSALPNDFGNLTRLVTLNLADNQLTDLPLSMGKCESMDSCQLERNPITNEALMAKYKIGTDHLIDYLTKRLFEHEQLAKAKAKAGIDPRNKKPSLSDKDGPSSSNATGSGTGKSARPSLSSMKEIDAPADSDWVVPGQRRVIDDDDEEPAVILTPEQQEALAWSKLSPEDRNTKKRYAAQATCHEVRQKLSEVKKGIMVSKTVEESIPFARVIRDLKNEIEKISDMLPRYEKPQPAPLFAHETKFQQLKKTTLVACKEVEAVINAVLNTSSTLIPEDKVDTYRTFLKAALARLDEQLGNSTAK